jgi:opacity protein-like surface antigen
MRDTLAAVLLAVSVMAWSRATYAQRGGRLAVQPGYAHAFDVGSGSVGGAVSLLVQRTSLVAVGGEAGFFGVGGHTWTVVYRNPTLGPTTLREHSEQSFWFLAALARYRLPRMSQLSPYVALGAGLYLLRETLTNEELPATGDTTRVVRHGYTAHSEHPGVSAGLGLEWWPDISSWSVVAEVRVHSILGAGSGFYPVAVVSVGVAKRL